jgi:hypothetical protein
MMMSNTPAIPKKKLGRKVNLEDAIDQAVAAEAKQPQINQQLYVVFYYETKEGDTGFGNIVLSGIVDIRTRAQLEGTITTIMQRNPHYSDIQIVNKFPLES